MSILLAAFAGQRGLPFSASAPNVFASREGFGGSGRVPEFGSAFTLVTVTGGIGPFTYAWTKLSDADGQDFTIVNETGANAGWNGQRPSPSSDDTESWRCTVTDTGDNNNTTTVTINVTLVWNDIS